MNRLPPVTRALLVVNVGVFLLQLATGNALIRPFALWPTASPQFPNAPSFEIWQLVTYGFLHGSLTHLLFNMLFLWMFGSDLERFWGKRRFYYYYFLTGVGAGCLNVVVKTIADPHGNGMSLIPTIGASGAIASRLRRVAAVCSSIVEPTTSRVAGSSGPCPEM